MSVARFVDFKQTRTGGSLQPGGWGGRRITYNALLHEGRAQISDHI